MSFVPVTGPATFEAVEPARDSVVVFTDDHRTVSLPIRAALPVLTRAHQRDDAHPTVGLLAGAVLLAMRMVAAGKIEPDQRAGWQISELDADDQDRLERLVEARAPEAVADPTTLVRSVMDAVADAMPRSGSQAGAVAVRRSAAPARRRPGAPRPVGQPGFSDRLARRLARHTGAAEDDRPHLVTLSLRVEADEGELVGGCVRLVLQVHDERNPLHFADAALLWTESGPDATHGFGDRARTHASIALRAAADAWPVLDRLLELRVPDEITLDAVELADLLESGLPALKARGVDVLWPRSLGRDLTAVTVLRPGSGKQEEPLIDGLFGPESLFSFTWQLALHGDPLTQEEMDLLAEATGPVVRLRDNWMVVDPAMARRAKKRLVRTAKPAQALAATLTGVVTVEDVEEKVLVGATLEKVRERITSAATREPVPVPAALRAELRDYQLRGLTWLAEMTGLGLGGCLADDMGLGKTITVIALHLHRLARDPAAGPTLVVCPASLLGNWEREIDRFAPGIRGAPLPRHRPRPRRAQRRLRADHLRHHAPRRRRPRRGHLGPGGRRRGAAREEPAAPRPPRRCAGSEARARVALTGTPVENNLSELWAILDWTTPGLLGSRNAFRQGRGRRRSSRVTSPSEGAAVRRADRPVPAAPPQVRPRHRARAAAQDRDRPPGRR